MLLAIDIGNSNISVGIFEIATNTMPELISHFKITSAQLSYDELLARISDLLSRNDIHDFSCAAYKFRFIDCAVISSVVPSLTDTVIRVAAKICGKRPFVINCGIRTGFEIKIKNPEQLGTDIVCNCAATLELFNGPSIILDMGTATTLTVIDKKLTIQGTVIIPGLRVSLEALYNSAAQLGDSAIGTNVELIGKDTNSAISSGIINGSAFMIDGFVRNIREQLGLTGTDTKLSLIATGGLAEYVLPCLRNKFIYHETLTLLGQALLYCRNNKI